MVYPRKIGNFIYRMAYSKPKNSNSNYGKSVFKELSVLWQGPYKRLRTTFLVQELSL